jgi:dTDP-glucose 4,6-dehydratase
MSDDLPTGQPVAQPLMADRLPAGDRLRLVVTGGAGFIGRHFVRRALAQPDCEVLTLDKLGYAAQVDALADHPRHHLLRLDLADADGLPAVLADFAPHIIVHLAAESHVDRSIAGPAAFIHSNVIGTYRLLEATLAYWRQAAPRLAATGREFRLHHVSTDEVFGHLAADAAPFAEDSAYRPRSPYSATKAAADHLVAAWHTTYGLPTIISHSSNNYGPGQHREKLIPHTIHCCLTGQPVPLYGAGANIRDWLHVADHVEALWRLARHGAVGGRYLVGGGCELTNREVVSTVCACMDELHPRPDGQPHATAIRQVADRPGHDFRYAMDCRRIRTELGWQPQVAWQAGLRDTVAWYCAHPAEF